MQVIYLDLVDTSPPSFSESLNLPILADLGFAVLSIISKQHLLRLVRLLGRKPNPSLSNFHISLSKIIERFSFTFDESLLLSILHTTPTIFKQILVDIQNTIHSETEPSAEIVSLICDFMCENRVFVRDVRDFLLERAHLLTNKQRNNLVYLFDFTDEGDEDLFQFFQYILTHQSIFTEEVKQYGMLQYLVWKNESQNPIESQQKPTSNQNDPRITELTDTIEDMIFEYVSQDKTFNRHVKVSDDLSVQMYPSLCEFQQNYFWTNLEFLRYSQDIKRETINQLEPLCSENYLTSKVYSPRVRMSLPSLFPAVIFRAMVIRTLGQQLVQRRLLLPEIVHMVEEQFLDQIQGYMARVDKEKTRELSQIKHFQDHSSTFSFKFINGVSFLHYYKVPCFILSEFDWTLLRVNGLSNSKILQIQMDEDGQKNEPSDQGGSFDNFDYQSQNFEYSEFSAQRDFSSYKDNSSDQKPVHLLLKKDFNTPIVGALNFLLGLENYGRFIYFDELFFNNIK